MKKIQQILLITVFIFVGVLYLILSNYETIYFKLNREYLYSQLGTSIYSTFYNSGMYIKNFPLINYHNGYIYSESGNNIEYYFIYNKNFFKGKNVGQEYIDHYSHIERIFDNNFGIISTID